MSKIFLLSDHHFKHEAIIKYTSRPFSLTREMNAYMIQKHNEVVTDEDDVFFLGDFCFSHTYKDVQGILNNLKGKSKHLILGNHDKINAFDYVEAGFTSVHTSLMLEDYLLIHDPAIAGVIKTMKVIHGHLHGIGLKIAPNTWNVSVEMHDYTPVDFEYIKDNWYGEL